MLDYRTSALFQKLVREGVAKLPVGAGSLGMKGAGGSDERADRQVMADAKGRNPAPAYGLRKGEERSPILIWINPNMSKATGRNTSRVVLEIVGVE